ncbi:MAG: SPOR domain-containing protein [Aromatoleum sp.]|uniref:SPOR domain-containing protein n=1 Tax=Aromatoleum sp. TaxID=2307007 RepID=UPI002895873F|nr:SPOR domain-containing protein [Aromatoleum sp.]MDT3669844.1 SPOR domain-containing protein [Aromatoleum sp.]
MTENDNLELKKRSRRRLVGAAALALLAAIMLPMVMDQEPGSPTQDIQITIPDREADSTLARPIADGSAAVPDPQIAALPDEQSGSTAPEADVPIPPAPAEAPPPAAATSKAPAPPPRAPERAPVPPAPAAKDDGARAIALLEGKNPRVPVDESFVVQVGAFGEASKANAVGTDLKKRGFAAYTEKAGTVTRVRVGPFASRDDAEKVAARLRDGGMKGVVVPR